jgi:hypothetical protein
MPRRFKLHAPRNWPAAVILAAACLAAAPSFTTARAEPLREVNADRGARPGGLNVTLFNELVDDVTNKMLASDSFKRLLGEYGRPRIVIGLPGNRTQNENMPLTSITMRMSEILIESGQVRWFEFGTNEYDLIISPMLSETAAIDGKRQQYLLTLTITLSDVNGEVFGRWSAQKAYAR